MSESTQLSIPDQLDTARRALVSCRTDFERLRVRDAARAAEAAAKILGRRDIQVEAAELIQDAERAIHKANPPKPEGGPGRGKKTVPSKDGFYEPPAQPSSSVAAPAATAASPVAPAIERSTLRNIRAVHSKLTDEEYEARKSEARERAEPLTRAALATPKRPRSGNASHDNDDEWYTPPALVEACRAAMGGIDLDPASHEVANRVVKAARYFSAVDSGLTKDWGGRVFLNPPYSKKAGKAEFLAKLATEYQAQRVTAACVVLSYDFSPSWFRPLRPLYAAIALCHGRIQFYKQRPGDGHDPALGTSVVYLGSDVSAFAAAFADASDVVVPYAR